MIKLRQMIILNIDKISKNFGFGQLFEDVSFSLNEAESISIVGPNGCGKSTLLKIIAGLEKSDTGSVNIKKGAKVAYLDQTGSSIKDVRPVQNVLMDAFKELNEIEERMQFFQNKLNDDLTEKEHDIIVNKYSDLVDKFLQKGGYDIEYNINIVIEGLKINKNILSQSYDSLSGGEKTLVQLAKALLLKPDLFLLDEPTNHLDIDRIEWLENYIKSFKGATVIVSHDRYFLDKMSNKILALDFGKAKVYSTNYTGYLEERQRDFEKQLASFNDQQLAFKRLEEQIKYFSQMGMAKNSSTMCDRAHALQTQLERMRKNAIEKPKENKKIALDFQEERKTSKTVIQVKNLTVQIYGERKILDDVNIQVAAKERVALIGRNGSGKSTFIKTIMGMQNLPVIGEVSVGPGVKIGYLPQIIEFENEEIKLLDYFKDALSLNEQKARQILSAFHFYQEDVNKRMKNLSGGEKMRVKLAQLLQNKINTLIFDEPTNHIDLPTKEILEDALEDFSGTLIFVSHDRYFINKFADKTIEFKDGKVQIYYGNYDYYKEKKNNLKKSV